ncbi:MAG: hypothetical protein ACPLPW_08205 [bacterium]
MRKEKKTFIWTGGDPAEIAGVRGVWIPNQPRYESEFTSEEIERLLNCPGIETKSPKEEGE